MLLNFDAYLLEQRSNQSTTKKNWLAYHFHDRVYIDPMVPDGADTDSLVGRLASKLQGYGKFEVSSTKTGHTIRAQVRRDDKLQFRALMAYLRTRCNTSLL